MSSLAIIGGSGMETWPAEYSTERMTVETPFGAVSLLRAQAGNTSLYFLSRHGETHGTAPHEVNYRANVAALAQLGVRRVIATNAVGSLRPDLVPGSIVLLNDFIDFTRSRGASYWDGHPDRPAGVVHTDFTFPYCPGLRDLLIEASAEAGVDLLPRAVYLCVEGPRFESPAEVKLFATWGADVVGMTGLPEAVFAREAGLCYAAVAIVTNLAAGLSETRITHTDTMERMAEASAGVRALLLRAAVLNRAPDYCASCQPAGT